MTKAMYIGIPNNPTVTLPSGYTQLEYIESTGTQDIDTGVDGTYKAELDIQFVGNGTRSLMGCSQSNGNYFGATATGYYELNAEVVSSVSGLVRRVITVDSTSSKLSLTADGTTISCSKSKFDETLTLHLFRINSADYYASAKLYGCKIYEDGVLVRNFIPCKNSSGTAGLYDLVNSKFYTNSGSGTLATGASFDGTSVARKVNKMYVGVANKPTVTLPTGYTEVEYIESSGTQYIDTGFTPDSNTHINISFQFLGTASATNAIYGARTAWANAMSTLELTTAGAMIFGYGTSYVSITPKMLEVTEYDMNKNVASVNGSTSTITTNTFTAPCSAYLFAENNNGSPSSFATGRMYSCKIYDNGSLVRNFVPCKNNSGTVGLYDTANSKFYTNAGSGTFTAGTVLDGKSFARKVKKAYIGVNGIARVFFGGKELRYKGKATALNNARFELAGASVGNYALFQGGGDSTTASVFSVVDAYSSSLTHSTFYTTSARKHAGISFGKYALFGGGHMYNDYNNIQAHNKVYAIDSSLTAKQPTTLSASRYNLAGATVGDYALFAGGQGAQYFTTVEAYDSNLSKSAPAQLSLRRKQLAGVTIGDYALFAGGDAGTGIADTVDAYNSSLARSTPAVLSVARYNLASTTVGNYAIFAGGLTSSFVTSAIDVFDKSLTKVNVNIALSKARSNLTATTLDGYAIFAGGYGYGNDNATGEGVWATVDVFDESLTMSSVTVLSQKRENLASATVGNYALFAGGNDNSNTAYNTVDVYELA